MTVPQILPTSNLGKTPLGEKTCTSNIYDIQCGLIQICQKLINREDIAATLAKRNILRQVRTIQISINIKFVSIEFDTPTIMETFSLEPLEILGNFVATSKITSWPPWTIKNRKNNTVPKNTLL